MKITISRSGLMQVVFKNECKSCEISNPMSFNVMFCFHLRKQKANWLRHNTVKLFNGSISYGASNEPEECLEPSQTSMRECFCEK